MKRSKKYNEVAAKVVKDHLYTPLQAVTLAKETTTTKYDSTIDVSMVLGVDPKKADQAVRSTVNLPHGTGKTSRVLVFAGGEHAEVIALKAAGEQARGATAIVTLTHDPRIDDMALMEALKSPAFYVGALGSRKNTQKRKERLLELELNQEQVERLHGPVGLYIGALTPPEIAVSILAEVIAVKYGIAVPKKN